MKIVCNFIIVVWILKCQVKKDKIGWKISIKCISLILQTIIYSVTFMPRDRIIN